MHVSGSIPIGTEKDPRIIVFLLLLVMLFTPIIFDRGLSAELKTSAIDNKYDIPFVMPSQLGGDLKHSIQLNNSNQHDNSETLDNEMMLGNASQTNNGMNFALVCSKMPIASVIANGNDGNLPTNTIDNNLNTRWSNLGTGSWIQLDLGSMESICSVDVNWYRGDIRQNNFVISVSTDGTTFTDKFSGTSNLGTTAEKYSLPAGTEGRYVRITVNGNTENQWASVTEVAVNGLEQASSGPIILKKQTAPGSNTWIPYKSLGGNFKSNPVVAINSDNTLQVFAVSATNGELLYKKQTAPASNTWTPYKSLGGNIQSDPSVIRNSDNTLQVFAVSATNGELLYKKQTAPASNTWTPYKSLGGNFKSNPVVAINSDNTLQVFAVSATNGELLYKKQTAPASNTWTPYKSLGGNIQSDPSVIRNSDNTLQVFAVSATNGELLYKKQTAPASNTWTPYKSLGGNIQSDPSVIRNSDNTLQVFAVSATNGELLYKKQTAPASNTWTPYKSLGGNIQSDPSVIRNSDNTLQVFAVSATNGELLYKKQTAPASNTWTPYKSLGGNIQSDPSVTLNNAARLEAFVIGPEGATGNPPGSSTTKDGVTVPFKIKGEWDYEYETDERDGGARYNMNAAGTSLVMVGYFTMSGGDDDVAAKLLGGRHTDSAPYDGCVYDPAIQTDNGQPRLRAECPHPDYTGNLDLDFSKQGISYHGKWVGTMAAAIQEQNGVRIQLFQDQGDNEVKPANQWVKVLEFFDDGTKVSGIEGADRFPIRELPASAQNTWRIDESPGLQEKWLAIAEIDVSQ